MESARSRRKRKKLRQKKLFCFVSNAWMIMLIMIVLLPIFLLILYSLAPSGQVSALKLSEIISSISLEGYRDVFRQTPFLKMGMNSLWISCVETGLQLFVAFLTAYAISRWEYPFKKLIYRFIVATMIIPTVAVMIPNYVIINNLGLVGNKWGVVLPFVASGYAMFLMNQFFKGVPKSLVEAAMLDGCTELRILFHIYLPMTLPAIAALVIILFVGHWNDYQWPLMVLNDPDSLTLPLALVRFKNEGIIEWMPTAAACVMTMIVPLILFLCTQRAFVETFADSAVKG